MIATAATSRETWNPAPSTSRSSTRTVHAPRASDSHLGLIRAPYVLYGVKFIDLVSLDMSSGRRKKCTVDFKSMNQTRKTSRRRVQLRVWTVAYVRPLCYIWTELNWTERSGSKSATLFRRLFLMTARGQGFVISSQAPLREGGRQE